MAIINKIVEVVKGWMREIALEVMVPRVAGMETQLDIALDEVEKELDKIKKQLIEQALNKIEERLDNTDIPGYADLDVRINDKLAGHVSRLDELEAKIDNIDAVVERAIDDTDFAPSIRDQVAEYITGYDDFGHVLDEAVYKYMRSTRGKLLLADVASEAPASDISRLEDRVIKLEKLLGEASKILTVAYSKFDRPAIMGLNMPQGGGEKKE